MQLDETARAASRGMTLSEMASSTAVKRDRKQQPAAPAMLAGVSPKVEGGSAASRILDELLGDMLAILEDSEEESEDNDEDNSDSASSSLASSSSDNESTLKVPHNATSPAPSDREEGEVESEEDLRLKQQRKLLAQAEAEKKEARSIAKEGKKKKSIERNVSQRDVFRYLKNNGFSTKLLKDFTQACISKSDANDPAFTKCTSQQPKGTSDIDVPAGPSKEDLHKLSSTYSFKRILHKAEKAKESKDAIGRLLDSCTTIVAEEEAAQLKQRQKQSEKDRRFAQEKVAPKGNYTGRRHMIDRSTATDPVANTISSAQAGPSSTSATTTHTLTGQANKPDEASAARNNRLPTPTSPTRNTAVLATNNDKAAPTNLSSSLILKDTERAAKAAKFAARFQHVLNSKQLNSTKQDLEKYKIRQPPPFHATTTSSSANASTSNTANQLSNITRAPLHPALNGTNIASSSSSSEPFRQLSSRDVEKGPRGSRQNAATGSFRPVGSTSESTARINGSSSSSRVIQGSNGTHTTASSISMSKTTVNSTSTDSASSTSAAANAKSIYDLIPDNILQKKKSPNAYNSSLPPRGGEDTSMQVDEIPSQPTASTSNANKDLTTAQAPHSPSVKMSLALPSAGIPARERENPTDNSNVGMWFGSLEPQDGAYSPLASSEAPRGRPPAPRRIPSLPPLSSVPTLGVRPFRTSMSPPPSNRGHGSAHSPPPPLSHSPPPLPPPRATSSLPPPPSHLPARPGFNAGPHLARENSPDQHSPRPSSPDDRLRARPVYASESHKYNNIAAPYPPRPNTNPEKLKAMFPTSFHKPTALPKKAHTYNEVTSSNEAVPIVQKQTRGLDPRMIAAERMKLLREKERDSENSDKEKVGTSFPSATLSKQSTKSISGIQPQARAAVLMQGQKDAMESSASPDSLFKGPDDMDDHGMDFSVSDDQGAPQGEKAYSPPSHSKAQQATNANMPLPSFRRAGQVTDSCSVVAGDDEKKRRELELKNRLKRARDENSSTPNKDTSNKRQAREVTSTIESAPSRTTKDASPPLPSSSSKRAHAASAQNALPNNAPSTSRKLVNSAGRRVLDMHEQHAIEDDEDEEEAVAVAPSRTDKPSPPKKTTIVPVVEVSIPSSRQGSIASTNSAREVSVDSRVGGSGKPKSVVARKSTGGFRQKDAAPASATATTTSARQSTAVSTSAPALAKEGIKVTLKLGGGRTATAITHRDTPTHSSSSKGTPSNATKATQKTSSSKVSRTVIEIDDSSDDTDDTDDTDQNDDIPFRKEPVMVKKAGVATSSSATPVASPPSSVNKARPRARPLAGSGTRLSDIGLSQSPAKAMRSSSTDEEPRPPARSQTQSATERSAPTDSAANAAQAPSGSSKSTASSGKETSLPAVNLLGSQLPKRQATSLASTVPSLATAKNMEDQPPAIMSSPPMPQRNSLSPPFDEQDADEVIPDSESEAYSPSQMPRYSLSPVPNGDAFELPSTRVSPPAQKTAQKTAPVQTNNSAEAKTRPLPETTILSQPEASLNPPPMPMTQVASSQSPEDSQMLRSASEAAVQFEDEVDMLASDGEDNALAEDLLKDTLDVLPDLPVVPATVPLKVTVETQETSTKTTSTAGGSIVQMDETVTSSTMDQRINAEPIDRSTQKVFMDPMDLSQAFGDDDDEDEENGLQSPPQSQQSGQVNMQPSSSLNLQYPQEDQPMLVSTEESPMTTASSLEKTDAYQQIAEEGQAPEQMRSNASTLQDSRVRLGSDNRQSKRATASDFMAAQVLPPRSEFTEAHERTPVLDPVKLPGQAQQQSNTSPTFKSPVAPPSEAESFEIIMGEQSPMQSLTGNAGPPASEISQHTRSTLEALDKPLEESFTRCRWNTGCLDMNCTFAHPSPSLHSRWATNIGALPKQKKECPDAVFCSNPACIFSHPSPAARRKEVCVNQANCPYGVKCIFRHVDEGSSQLTRRYQSHNQSTRFVNSPVVSNAPTQMARQHLSPPPTIVPGTTTTHAGNQVSSSTLPFLSYHSMPPIPPGSTPPLSRSTSPAVNASNTAGPSTSSSGGSISTYPHASASRPEQQSPQSHTQEPRTMQQSQQPRPQGPHRSWTNLGGAAGAASSAAGWLANKAGLSKGS